MTTILAILAVGFLIFFHELGHLLVGRWRGLPAVRFSIGMGPVVLRWQALDVEWALSAIPFGGYVLFDAESEGYQEAGALDKILTSLAGPAANILMAILLYIVAASLDFGSLAVELGLEKTWGAVTQTFQVVGMLLTGEVGVKDLAGPVHMVSIGSELATEPHKFLSYMGFISINLAVLNLLPIPALDGGQILLTVFQRVMGRPLPERAQLVMVGGSYVLLFGLIAWVMVQDVVRLFS